MNKVSYFIENRVAFGSFPTQDDIDELEICGFVHFIDLTSHLEKGVSPYQTRFNRVKFPIRDGSVPYDFRSFCSFISCLLTLVNSGDKIYIHCKGGHGRSILVVSCILYFLYNNITVEDALIKASEYHNTRKELKTKWIPFNRHQTNNQRLFVKRVCKYRKIKV
jgi:protein-tyrosine phosphatase